MTTTIEKPGDIRLLGDLLLSSTPSSRLPFPPPLLSLFSLFRFVYPSQTAPPRRVAVF